MSRDYVAKTATYPGVWERRPSESEAVKAATKAARFKLKSYTFDGPVVLEVFSIPAGDPVEIAYPGRLRFPETDPDDVEEHDPHTLNL